MNHYHLKNLLECGVDGENDYLRQFDRLIFSRPSEILIWEGGDYENCPALAGGDCTCGAGSSKHWDGINQWGDIEIWIPCTDPTHAGCGRFSWILNVATREYREAERAREEEDGDEIRWDEILLDVDRLTHKNQITAVRHWLAANVEPLADVSVRMASYQERRDRTAHYAEWHTGEADLYDRLDAATRDMEAGNFILLQEPETAARDEDFEAG